MRAMKSKDVIKLSHLLSSLEVKQMTMADIDRERRLINIEAIDAAKEAGVALLSIKQDLAPATEDNPIETDLGWFTSFDDYINKRGWVGKQTYDYVKLAENWDIALKLGVQDVDNPASDLELSPLVKVIEWYIKSVDDGVDPKLLTLRRFNKEQRSRRSK